MPRNYKSNSLCCHDYNSPRSPPAVCGHKPRTYNCMSILNRLDCLLTQQCYIGGLRCIRGLHSTEPGYMNIAIARQS